MTRPSLFSGLLLIYYYSGIAVITVMLLRIRAQMKQGAKEIALKTQCDCGRAVSRFGLSSLGCLEGSKIYLYQAVGQ